MVMNLQYVSPQDQITGTVTLQWDHHCCCLVVNVVVVIVVTVVDALVVLCNG